MVLRLSVPAEGTFASIAADLAIKIAEYLGRTEPGAGETGEAVKALTAKVAPNGTGGDEITFEFHQVGDELRIEARCAGRSSEARHPLPT
jgi:hypothetical protein